MRPARRQPVSRAVTASASPETTTEEGPLTAATATWVPYGARASATSCSVAATASMAPPAGSACMSLPRAATRVQASSSERTPATCAAASSPTEWPRRKSGVRPQVSSSRKRATSRAKSAAWVYRVRSSGSPSPKSTSRSGRSSSPSIRAHTASSASAKAGWVSYSSLPIPARCAPWPVKRKATRLSRTEPRTACGGSSPAARASRAATQSAVPAARTTARCSRSARDTAREWATSTGRSPVWDVRWALRAAAWARSPAGVLAETVQGRTRAAAAAGSTGAGASGACSGACSMMTWALVPLTPKDETPARRGRPLSGQSRASVSSSTAPAVQSTCTDGSSTCSVLGRTP